MGTQFTRRRQPKQKTQHNTVYVGQHYAQTNTNNVDKTGVLLQTTGGKDDPNIVSNQMIVFVISCQKILLPHIVLLNVILSVSLYTQCTVYISTPLSIVFNKLTIASPYYVSSWLLNFLYYHCVCDQNILLLQHKMIQYHSQVLFHLSSIVHTLAKIINKKS